MSARRDLGRGFLRSASSTVDYCVSAWVWTDKNKTQRSDSHIYDIPTESFNKYSRSCLFCDISVGIVVLAPNRQDHRRELRRDKVDVDRELQHR